MRIVPKHQRLVNVGDTVHHLTVIGAPFYVRQGKSAKQFAVFKCECGNHVAASLSNIRHGKTRACGCNMVGTGRHNGNASHLAAGTRLYWVWAAIVQRCTNPKNKRYRDYGGRGITICDEWKSAAGFISWALASGYRQGLCIDRVDNNAGYFPDNCRWTTQSVNNSNRRTWKVKK